MNLSGKIYWLVDDNDIRPKELERTIAKIESTIIDEGMIQFVIPNSENNLDRSYKVNLLRNVSGLGYSNHLGEIKITCEVFENEKAYLLNGEWIEDANYIWWAKLQKG